MLFRSGADEGANRQARLKAAGAMEGYFTKNRNVREAAQYLVNAAYNAQKLHRAGKETGKAKTWCDNTMKAFDSFKGTTGPDGKDKSLGSVEADMAAECAYRAVDEELKAKWDYDAGHHRYSGVIDKVKEAYEKDLKAANDVWSPKLQNVIEKYNSPKWSIATRARQGSVYDSIRTGLYNATPPQVRLYNDKEEKLLKMAETSEDDDLILKADEIRQTRREVWRKTRDDLLAEADKVMVNRYAEAVVWAKAYKIRTDAVDHAIRRLAFFTDIIGNQKIRDYSQGIVDPETKQPFVYTDNLFLKSRPGLTLEQPASGMPVPLPVAP